MFLPCEINSLNLDLLHRGSLVLLRLCCGCPEWDAAVTRGWSFSVLRVWFHPWPWAHISWNLIRSWADNIRANAGQRYCGELNTEEIWAGDEPSRTSAEAQQRWGVPPPLYDVHLFIPGVIRSMCGSGYVSGVARVTVPQPAGICLSFYQIYTLWSYRWEKPENEVQTPTGFDCKHVVFMSSSGLSSYFREIIFSSQIAAFWNLIYGTGLQDQCSVSDTHLLTHQRRSWRWTCFTDNTVRSKRHTDIFYVCNFRSRGKYFFFFFF